MFLYYSNVLWSSKIWAVSYCRRSLNYMSFIFPNDSYVSEQNFALLSTLQQVRTKTMSFPDTGGFKCTNKQHDLSKQLLFEN